MTFGLLILAEDIYTHVYLAQRKKDERTNARDEKKETHSNWQTTAEQVFDFEVSHTHTHTYHVKRNQCFVAHYSLVVHLLFKYEKRTKWIIVGYVLHNKIQSILPISDCVNLLFLLNSKLSPRKKNRQQQQQQQQWQTGHSNYHNMHDIEMAERSVFWGDNNGIFRSYIASFEFFFLNLI